VAAEAQAEPDYGEDWGLMDPMAEADAF